MRSLSGMKRQAARSKDEGLKVLHKKDKKDIISIIETCFKCGVTKLELGELKVEFQPRQFLDSNVLSPTFDNSVPQVSGTNGPDDIMSLVDRTIVEQAEEDTLLMTDPDGYEQQQIDRQLGS